MGTVILKCLTKLTPYDIIIPLIRVTSSMAEQATLKVRP